MKQKPVHIFLVLMLLVLSHQLCFAMAITQEPEVHRVFDSDFKERYASDKYNYEGKKVVNETSMGSGEYEDFDKEKINIREKNNKEDDISFSWLFIVMLFVAVVYLAYILINEGSTGLFTLNKNKSIERYDDITAENIENADILTLIKQAENDHDYRLAIRYYYLLVLKTLTLKNHIKFEDDKTNAEYLNEINKKSFSKGFSYVSYLYNYIWYGKFNLEASQYSKAKDNFKSLLNQVK